MKIRLWIEYALVALVLAVAGFAVTIKVQSLQQETHISELSSALERTREQIGVVASVNDAQEQVIMDLADQREVDGKAIVDLMDTYKGLAIIDKNLRGALAQLEKDNEQARSYLNGTIPESVSCLYDGSCPPSDNGNQGSQALPSGRTVTPLLSPQRKEAEK